MKICMVVPAADVKGGIASVINGYREYGFGKEYDITYIESYRNGTKWQKLAKAVRGYLQFFKEINRNVPDIVHIHSSFGPSFYRKMPFIYMASLKKIPIVNHIHGADFDTFYLKASANKKKLIKKVYCKCQIMIALSDEWRDNLKLIVPDEKILVVENYCRIPELSEKERKRQILFLGEIGQRKGCMDIPEILEKAFAKTGKVETVLAGDGDLAKVEGLIAEKGLSDSVSFPGWVRGDRKTKLLGQSSIFLFPSYKEGMPMALLEAMAYGLAIVTTDVGGIPKLLEDGVSGYLCRPGETQQLADRLAQLLADDAKCAAFGKAAREKAEKEYSLESHLAKLFEAYRRACAERGKNGAKM